MTDYTELIKALRCCDEETPAPCVCMECPRRNYTGSSYYDDVVSLQDCERALMHEAADAIEELLATKEHYKEECHAEQAPTNVVPVKQGRWVAVRKSPASITYACSNCEVQSALGVEKYCWNCGAKMEASK